MMCFLDGDGGWHDIGMKHIQIGALLLLLGLVGAPGSADELVDDAYFE